MQIFGSHRRNKIVKKSASVEADSLSLEELCKENPELYEPLEYFLLFDPARQLPHLDSPQSLLLEGDAFCSEENQIQAKVDFDLAARIAMYYQDQETARRALNLAYLLVTDENERERYKALLSNLQKAIEIAREYYKDKPRIEAERQTVSSPLLVRIT